jgi:hypothetical protein
MANDKDKNNKEVTFRKIEQFRFSVRSAEFINGGGIVVLLAAFTALADKANANLFVIFLAGAGGLTVGLFLAVMANWLMTSNINREEWNNRPFYWLFLSLHWPILVVIYLVTYLSSLGDLSAFIIC